MPELSRFYGITIDMYFDDNEHNPPHVHATYNSYEAEINIKTLQIIRGKLPRKALQLVIEWMKINQNEILEIWNTQQFTKLKPLD